MSDISPATRPSDPVDLIRQAVNAADRMGITVSTVQSLGVHCTSTHAPRWERDGRTDCVSPLGAVLLVMQPPVPDIDAAIAHALGVSTLWCIGFDDGQAKQPPSNAFAAGPARRLYAEGFEAGTTFRAVMHRRQGVPVERPLGQDTEPMQLETPRSVIAELVSSLTVAQVLEALADSIPGRKLPADDAAEWVEVLRELAEEARKDGQ